MRQALAALALLLAAAPVGHSQSLCSLDKAKMIPLRDATYRAYQFTAKLEGSAIAGDTPYEIHFDTGSWTTSIPGGALDFSQVTVIQQDVTTDWGRPADLVEGQLALRSTDGTLYTIDDYRFYALKESPGGAYLPDDRTAVYGNGAIMGGFPSPYLHRDEQAFPYLLAQKYAADRMGMGIVSACRPEGVDLAAGWASLDSYLQIGNAPEITDHLAWRSDVANWTSDAEGFYPEAVPGFQIEVDFPDTSERIVTADDLIATVDTGAPDLTLRLTPDDPQYSDALASHFLTTGPWTNWNNPNYNSHATTLVDAAVTVLWTDDDGATRSYRFDVPSDPNEAYHSPASLYAGRWSGGVPWVYSEPSFPRNRINLGNSLYYYWPVYYWDIKNQRVGIGATAWTSTSAEAGPSAPVRVVASPNPASDATRFRLDLAEAARVRLAVYDVLGREVAVLASGDFPAGSSEVTWEAGGHPAGVYLYRLTAGSASDTGRITLAR